MFVEMIKGTATTLLASFASLKSRFVAFMRSVVNQVEGKLTETPKYKLLFNASTMYGGKAVYPIYHRRRERIIGYAESYANLSQHGKCTVENSILVNGARVTGDAFVSDSTLNGKISVKDMAFVIEARCETQGTMTIQDTAWVQTSDLMGAIVVKDEAMIYESRVVGPAHITGNSLLAETEVWRIGVHFHDADIKDEADYDVIRVNDRFYTITAGHIMEYKADEPMYLDQLGELPGFDADDNELFTEAVDKLYSEIGGR